jgi:formylglycine-generating enzyme required for sulfatase activity
MSPEQARGEGHRVDGRSDLFSLGIVLYEVLTQQRPFIATSLDEMLRLVAAAEPRPPRQLNDAIPRELERICLKALARLASERYSTAHDMADDLEQFLVSASDARRPDSPTARMMGTPGELAGSTEKLAGYQQLPGSTSSSSPSQGVALRIIPRGLRSFDAADADFFLSLLPGPRDREGLPESIRFWRTRVDQTDPADTFPVGLVYGPSGCGKSSMIKAGLVPLLGKHVVPVYVEATADGTEARLTAALTKHCPRLPQAEGLRGALASLRRGQFLPGGKKVFIVLDQFEQWLHARKESPEVDLVEALRQCDGGRVQCLVLVRDDFWMAATRFMSELEFPLVEGHNSAAVDLFPVRHAEKVLAAFGRAFGALPDVPVNLAREHRLFLEQAVSGLAQEGKVICVRLALFAEMMKDRPWTPASLRGVGGTMGVGATFLEETFCAAGAPPERRYHQKAVRAVLNALLPNSGIDIKGTMRSKAELLALSGYANRPREFEGLLHILDSEARLITPTDPEGTGLGAEVTDTSAPTPVSQPELTPSDTSGSSGRPALRLYQLTHDYLVPSLRDWLTRKQRETRRGRAELRLAERAALWSGRPQNRFLPSWLEWLELRLLTRRRDWTKSQRAMMRHTGRYYTAWGLLLTAGLVLLLLVGREFYCRQRAQRLQHRLMEATTEEVPSIVGEMDPYRRWLNGPLREAYVEAEANHELRRQLHASLALLPVDSRQVGYLCDRVVSAGPEELFVIREALQPHAQEASARLWEVLEDRNRSAGARFRAACVLAAFAADDERWQGLSRETALRLLAENNLVIASWAKALRPVRRYLLPTLATFLVEGGQDAAGRRTLIGLFSDYAEGLPDALAFLELEANGQSKLPANPAEPLVRQRRQANAAAALAALGQWQSIRGLLRHTPDPTVRTYLIDRLGPSGVEPAALVDLLADDDVSVRRAVLLALGEFGEGEPALLEREGLVARLVELYRNASDPGIHSTTGWLLRRWGYQARVEEIDRALPVGKPVGERHWYVNAERQTMILIPPGKVQSGFGVSSEQIRVDRGFALAAREVTVAEFQRFRREHQRGQFVPTDDCPADVSWYASAAYCNWLSKRDGIPIEQWCYVPNENGEYAEGMSMAPNFLSRTGYRLPTGKEWEYACRAGSFTYFSVGEAEDLLPKYAWGVVNSQSYSHPVGTLRPNDLGLFDMHGNAWEWCQDKEVANTPGEPPSSNQKLLDGIVTNKDPCYFRGGAFTTGPRNLTSIARFTGLPSHKADDIGFRPARTVR